MIYLFLNKLNFGITEDVQEGCKDSIESSCKSLTQFPIGNILLFVLEYGDIYLQIHTRHRKDYI